MYLDKIRKRLRCRGVEGGGGGEQQNSKNGWVTNNVRSDPSLNYDYIYIYIYIYILYIIYIIYNII